MAGDKNHPDSAIVVELKVYMHCKACEKAVSKTLCKLKGVEKVSTDMDNNCATVVGQVEPKKVLKKLRKKTGKRAEIISNAEETTKDGCGGDEKPAICGSRGWMAQRFLIFEDLNDEIVLDLEMFSDENPTACMIM